MKLYDWLLKEDIADPLVLDTSNEGLGYKSDGLHVIGACKECKYALGVPWPGDIRCERDDKFYDYDFGCIHFEEKGQK